MRTQRELEDGLGGLSEEQNMVMVMAMMMVVVRMAMIVNCIVWFHIRISFDLELEERTGGQSHKLGIGQQRDLLTLNERRGEGEVGWGAVGRGASRAA